MLRARAATVEPLNAGAYGKEPESNTQASAEGNSKE